VTAGRLVFAVGGALAPTWSRLKPLLLRPLLHFLIFGALLFGFKQLTSDGRALGIGAEPIVVAAADVERLRAIWHAETRRPPTNEELAASIRRHADEELLVREALRHGLDRSDVVVRQRLVQNVRFARAEPELDEPVAFAEALALGMAHRDLVARRRLVQAMEERLAQATRVTDAEVREYVATHADRYAAPRRISFDQVYLSSDRHGSALDARAAVLANRLASEQTDAAGLGDPFLLGTRFETQSQADLARGFGTGFAAAAIDAPLGQWSSPIRSAYGVHFIRVRAVETPGAIDFAAVRGQARYALLEERERLAVQAAIAALRPAYPLRIEWPGTVVAQAP
jgi:peptidyl-prolyl cis-trans isomerase C